MPAIEALRARFDVPLSVDTWRASVLDAACAAGAVVGNDISGFADPDYLDRRGQARRDRRRDPHPPAPACPDPEPHYDDLVADVTAFLLERARRAEAAGLAPEQIVLDAGLDLGKTPAQSAVLLRESARARGARLPVAAVGVEQAVHRRAARARRSTTGAPSRSRRSRTASVDGCRIVRVHDVAGTARVCRTIEALLADPHEAVRRDTPGAGRRPRAARPRGAAPRRRAARRRRPLARARRPHDPRAAGARPATTSATTRRRRATARRSSCRRSPRSSNALQSPPFMTGDRVVVVREIGNLTAEQAQVARGVDRPIRSTACTSCSSRVAAARRPRSTRRARRTATVVGPASGADRRLCSQPRAQGRAACSSSADASTQLVAHLGDDAGRVPELVELLARDLRRRRDARRRRGRGVPRRARHRGPLRSHERDRPRRCSAPRSRCCTGCSRRRARRSRSRCTRCR